MNLAPNRLFKREALWMLLMPLAIIAIAAVGGLVTPHLVADCGPLQPSTTPRTISRAAVDALPFDATLAEANALLGPPARDVGSGAYLQEWDVDDGSVLQIGAAQPCSEVTSRAILAPTMLRRIE
jgi:hypothetical protein